MGLLLAGLAIFFLIHLVPVYQTLRHRLIFGMGEAQYKIAFSLISLGALYLIVRGYGEARLVAPELFDPPAWTRHITMLLMLIAFIILAAAYIPSRIRDRVRHPMLAAVKIWAFAHLIANGDGASFLLFGSFLMYAVYDRISVTRRGAMGPLGDRPGTLRGDIAVVVVGVAAYVAMLLWGHELLIGVPLMAPMVDIPS
ncbi:MAG: NnrU family protein [Hyphomicrobiaceae bacterium]